MQIQEVVISFGVISTRFKIIFHLKINSISKMGHLLLAVADVDSFSSLLPLPPPPQQRNIQIDLYTYYS